MFDEKVLLPEQLPIKEKQRKATDVCCSIVGVIFAISMFIVACVVWNRSNFEQMYCTKTGADYKPCPSNQFVSLQNPNDFDSRACVTSCPADFEVVNGQLCMPIDDSLKTKYMMNSKFVRGIDMSGFIKTLFYTFIIAIGFGLLRTTLTHCLPRQIPMISFGVAIILLLGYAAVSFATRTVSSIIGGVWSIIFGVALIIIAIVLLIMFCMYSSQIKFQSYMLQYAVKFLNQNPTVFIYIPVFILFHFGLIVLVLWQHSCFSSWKMSSNNFWDLSSAGFFDILNILEYIWGFQFLKDAFNFCISGNAVDWYWIRNEACFQPFRRLIFKNWGSVIGGSFLNAFLEIPTLFVQLFVCHPNTCCSKLGTICYNSCNVFTCFFELVRTDAYSYINLTGIPFCDAARQCAKLCDRSRQFVGYHSAMKHYRMIAHIASVSFVFFWSFLILDYRTFNFDLWNIGLLIMFIYGTVTWFVGIDVDSAEGLQTSYLAELQLEGEHQYMQKILPSMRKILQPLQNRGQGDGNC